MLMLFVGKNNIFADPVVIKVPNPGDLPTLIDATDKYQITELEVSGDINGDDIAFLRDMAGSDINLQPTAGILSVINLMDVNIVTGGGYYAFDGQNYYSVLGDNELPLGMFAYCKSLVTIMLPTNATSIGQFFVTGCTNLENLLVANESTAFYSLNGVLYNKAQTHLLIYPLNKQNKKFDIPSTVTNFPEELFKDNIYIEEVSIPEGVSDIPKEFFKNCIKLNTVSLPSTLTTIGKNAFDNCKDLTEVDLPNGLINIKEGAFNNSGLEQIAIPSSVTNIENWAFGGCQDLRELKMHHNADNMLQYRDNWGFNLWNMTLYVPAGSHAAYSNAHGWDSFSEILTFGYDAPVEPLAVTKHVTKPGDLSSLIDSEEKDKITELTVTGNLNSADILFIREMAGADISGSPTSGNLCILDMSGASIVASSDLYLSNPEVGDFHTEDNVIGMAMFLLTKLIHVTLPETATSAGALVFAYCEKLESIIVPETNTGLKSVDGVLYDKSQEVLYAYPAAKLGSSYTSPTTLEKIEMYAFQGNKKLKTVTLNEGLIELSQGAFYESSKLETISLPLSLNTIGPMCFGECPLKEVYVAWDIPLNIDNDNDDKIFDEFIISQCDLYVPEGSIGLYHNASVWHNFRNLIEVPLASVDPMAETVNVKTAGKLYNLISAANKNKITELTVTGSLNGDDIAYIREMSGSDIYGNSTAGNLQVLDLSGASIVAGGGHYLNHPDIGLCSTDNNQFNYAMFAFCTKLKEITVPANVESDGMALFFNCIRLESIHVPAANPYLASQDGVFFDKNKKTLFSYPAKKADQTYTVPASVETIKLYSFNGSHNLREVVLPSGLTNLEDGVFSNCYALETINIPTGLTEIPSQAFTNCYSLSNIELPTSLQIIGDAAFKSCNLKNIVLPNGLFEIGKSAFSDNKFKTINIPSSVTNIGDWTFSGNPLVKIQVNWDTPLSINNNTFNGLNSWGLVFVVPEGKVDNYKSASVWRNFENIITPVHVATAGAISDYLDGNMFDIKALVLTGDLNGDDIRKIRQMAGVNYDGFPSDGQLRFLDLSGANIVEGGFAYLQDGNTTENNTFGDRMFERAKVLNTLIIPNSLTTINDMVFKETYALNDIIVNPENTHFVTDDDALFSTNRQEFIYYYKSDFCDRYEIPASVTSIKGGAFAHKWMIWDLILPDNLVTIGDQAFIECNNIVNVSIPTNVISIGNRAFSDCSGLNGITIPDNVSSLGAGVFFNCINLRSVVLPNGLTEIKDQLFEQCPQLSSVNIPNTVTTIGNSAFKNCYSLGAISIPNGVETIENYAFMGCSALQTITVPEGVTTIEFNAFEYCSQLTHVDLPASLTKLGGRAFGDCESLAQLKVMNPTPLNLGESTFDNVPFATCVLIVPFESIAAYQAAPVWKQFFTITKMEECIDKIESKVFASGNHIVIKDADIQSMVDIYSITGSLIKSFTINSTYETIELPTGNMYIVKLNGINYKVVM